MKRILTFSVILFLFIPGINTAQTTTQAMPVPPEEFKSFADNIGYWMDAAERGLVQVNPSVPVKPAEGIKSKNNAKSIEQMSTDVCVWDETGVTQSENSISINPTNNSYVLNSNNSEASGSIYGANYLNSYNSGSSWTGSHDGAGGANRGDPAVAIGSNGRRYIGFITSGSGQGIAWSDNGTTWNPVAITGTYTYPDLMDKNHLKVDTRSSGTYSGYVYSAWTNIASAATNYSDIEFSRSTNSGVSWSSPINISNAIAAGSHNQGVNIQTGPTGQVYAVWVVYDSWYPSATNENAIGFARSLNGGSSFYSATRIHNNILGIRPSPYSPTSNATGKSMRVNSFPSMAVDISGGAYNGNIYVVWSNIGTPGTNTGTNVSVYCMRSTNGGVSWNTPVRVNQGSSADGYASFIPWITCDPITGKLYCVFYDDRNLGTSSTACEVWVAYSEDGGVSWDDFRVGDVSFTPSAIPGLASGYMGDYIGIDARDNKVYPNWTDNRSGRALTYVSPMEFTDQCIATGGCDEYISNVAIGSINNASDCEGYENYTNLSTDLLKGSTTNLTVTIGNGYSGDDVTVWADWNRDGDFEDASELIGYGTSTTSVSMNVTPPTSILSGPVTMRIRLSYTGTPPADPCGSTTFGEVEDYTLNVYEYCVAGGGCDEHIANVQIGSINNSSGCDGYADYTNLSTDIDYLSSATVTVTNGVTSYSSDQCGIWVDWNGDLDFADANETVTVSGTPGTGPYTALIDPPVGVTAGPKTMRVRITYTGTVSACGTTSYGEVEDYTINVTGVNQWVGSYNHYWHQAANWSAGHIPTSTEDVVINNVGYQPVYVDNYTGIANEACDNLTTGAGSTLEFYDMKLIVNGNMTVGGNILMSQDNGIIDLYGNAVWNSGSSFDATAYNTFINVWGDFTMNNGCDFSPATGFVDFEGSTDAWIRCYSTASDFYNLRVYKYSGAAAKVSNLSTYDLRVNGLLFITTNAIFDSYSSHNIEINGPFNYYGTFDFTQLSNTGSAVFNGTSQVVNNYSSGSGTFNNVVFSSSTGTTISGGDLNIAKNLTINEGYFAPGTNVVYVGGDWNNTVGDAGFTESGTHVVINGGNYHQYCSTETFDLLEINKSAGGAFRVNSGTVTCGAYNWTAGAVDVNYGTFTANDLIDDAVVGAFYVNPGGTINLINSGTGTYVDLRGELHNYGGTINLTGSVSWWPYGGDALVEMTGGVIDLTSCGLYLSSSNILTTSITGGTIRMNGGYTGNRADFTPTAGIIELYGTNDVSIGTSNGSTINDLYIDKSAKSNFNSAAITPIQSADGRIDNTINYNSEANTASMTTDLTITGELMVNSGSFGVSGHQLDVTGNITVAGNFIMTNAADVVNVGNEFIWAAGGTENITTGVINCDYRVFFADGSNAQLGSGNILNLTGTGTTAIRNYSALAELGTVNIAMPASSGVCYISYTTTYPVVISGDLNVYADNFFHIQEYDVIVNGDMDIAAGSTVQLGSVIGSGYLEVDGTLTNNGTLILDYDETAKNQIPEGEDISNGSGIASAGISKQESQTDNTDWFAGEVYSHGHFTQTSTGTLDILGGGTFMCDQPKTSYVSMQGNLNLDNGIFEISDNHLNLPAVCTITGGTIRIGGSLFGTISGNFQPTGGTVEFISTGATGEYILMHPNNYFYNLTINRTNTMLLYTGYDLNIKNDFTIISGGLNTNNGDMYVGGDWDNQVGTTAFLESTGKVVFNGTAPVMQYINSDETFNVLENNSNVAIRVNAANDDIVCNSYNWISGAVSVSLGTFTANDLAQNGIYGSWYALTNSQINLNQASGQYVDMYGTEFYVNGGTMTVTGGDDESYWCFGSPLNVTISNGGILDFDGPGITIFNSAALTTTMSGGTLKTSGWFASQRSDYNPTGSTTEFYGGADARIDLAVGSTLYNLTINKSTGDKSSYSFKDRNGETIKGTKSNTVYIYGNDLTVNGDMSVNDGTLDLNELTTYCYGNINLNDGGTLYTGENATLALDNGSEMHVNNGGWLLAVSADPYTSTITNISGYYDLWVENGGYISAENMLFEYMSTSGVYLRPGSVVNPVYSFNNCTFQNGAAGGSLMVIYNDQTFEVNDAVFPTNTWGSAYNVYKNSTSGNVYFINATGDFAGETYENDPYGHVFWGDGFIRLDLTAYLEGPYSGGGVMSTTLNTNGYIPLNQPYNPSMPYYDISDPNNIQWYYTGLESVGSIPVSAVDWVIIQIRDATTPASASSATAIGTQAAFIMSDGSIRGLDGSSYVIFDVTYSNNLYACVFHRNHLGIMSSVGLSQTAGVYSYDFSSGSAQVYGGINGHKEIEPGVWGLVAADGNGNGLIQNTDETAVWKSDLGLSGYMGGDFSMNGLTQNTDETDYWKPNLGGGGQVPAKAGTGYISQVPK
ncbi:MAG: exo-alpha-sialidase [Bacteroidales bacterium]|nr:exo-alpha-sialidase [Bacteroidales bacterium]